MLLTRCTLLIRANKVSRRAAYVSFTKQPGFAKLMSLIDRKAPDFSAKVRDANAIIHLYVCLLYVEFIIYC